MVPLIAENMGKSKNGNIIGSCRYSSTTISYIFFLHVSGLMKFCLWFDFLVSVLVVATDDHKIAECCEGFGADVVMTSESCRNGISPFHLCALDMISG